MHIGEISFCDRIGYNVKSDDVKKKILDEIEKLYGVGIIQKHFIKFNSDQIPNINKNPHLLTYKTNGNPYFLYLTKENFVNICVLIDKKIQHGYFYPRMILQKLWFDDEIFNNTLIDGEMVKCNDGTWQYIINDLIGEDNQLLSSLSLPKRIERLVDILHNKYVHDEMTPFSFQTKQYFYIDNVNALLAHIKELKWSCRGIYIRPLYLRFKDILLNFDDSLIQTIVHEKTRELFQVNESLHKITDVQHIANSGKNKTNKLEEYKELNEHKAHKEHKESNEQNEQKEKVFWIRKTATPDIYALFEQESADVSKQIACVNTMKTSKMLFNDFKLKNLVDKIQYLCIFSEKFEKWVPITKLSE